MWVHICEHFRSIKSLTNTFHACRSRLVAGYRELSPFFCFIRVHQVHWSCTHWKILFPMCCWGNRHVHLNGVCFFHYSNLLFNLRAFSSSTLNMNSVLPENPVSLKFYMKMLYIQQMCRLCWFIIFIGQNIWRFLCYYRSSRDKFHILNRFLINIVCKGVRNHEILELVHVIFFISVLF